jgi:hypothetical protein
MKTIIARCAPDEDVSLGHTAAWMRIELPHVALTELDELRMHGNAAPYQIRCIIAQLSVVVTIFDDNTRHGEPVVLDGSFSIPATQVRPSIEPPWAIITSEQVAFGIAVADADYGSDRPYAMLSEEISYRAIGIAWEVQDAVPTTR